VDEVSDRRTLDAIYREHFPSLMGTAFLMLGSNDSAEDLVHDVFLRCAPKLQDLDNPASYLRAAVINACRREHRRRARLVPLEVDLVGVSLAPELVDLRAILLRLPAKQRAAIVLRFHADLSYEDVASQLGCTPSTARSLVRRGTRKMRGEFDEG
jgi:RNA polymerase sigma factor (sigma-70 family)